MLGDVLISVIVPIYNKQAQISRCIESVKIQSYKNWELILIDDGSTDNSAFIIKSYLSDSRIFYFYKENGGVSSARNMGMKMASGEWIIFLDSDDYFLQNALSILLNLALSQRTLIAAANFYVENNGKRYGLCEGRKRIVKNNFRSWYFMTCYLRAGSTIFHSSVIKHFYFDEFLNRYEDIKWGFNIMRKQKIAYTPDYVMVYSEDNLGLSHKAKDINKDYTFSLDFVGKSFWERLSLIIILKQGLVLYPEYRYLLKSKYKEVWYLIYINAFLSVIVSIRIRFIRLIRKLKYFF